MCRGRPFVVLVPPCELAWRALVPGHVCPESACPRHDLVDIIVFQAQNGNLVVATCETSVLSVKVPDTLLSPICHTFEIGHSLPGL